MLGPSFPEAPPQFITAEKVKFRTQNCVLTYTKEKFNNEISLLQPDITVSPCPHPRKANYTRRDYLGFDAFSGILWPF